MSEDREAEHVGLGHFVTFRPTIHASSPKLFIRLRWNFVRNFYFNNRCEN